MIDPEQFYSAASRLAAVRASTIVKLQGLPADLRDDLQQEGLLELWRKSGFYDPLRGSWRTFAERVVANRMASIVRSLRSEKSGQYREEPLDNCLDFDAPRYDSELRFDIALAMARLSAFDRRVTMYLDRCSAIETSRALGVSRATVYRAIDRIRTALTAAGLSPRRREQRGAGK